MHRGLNHPFTSCTGWNSEVQEFDGSILMVTWSNCSASPFPPSWSFTKSQGIFFLSGQFFSQANRLTGREWWPGNLFIKTKRGWPGWLVIGSATVCHIIPWWKMLGSYCCSEHVQLPYHTILEIYSFLFQYSRDFNGPIDLENWCIWGGWSLCPIAHTGMPPTITGWSRVYVVCVGVYPIKAFLWKLDKSEFLTYLKSLDIWGIYSYPNPIIMWCRDVRPL